METLSNEQWKIELDEIAHKYETLAAVSTNVVDKHSNKSKTKPEQLAGYFDHTILKLDATVEEVDRLCQEAKDYGFAAVCVRENFVERARSSLVGTAIAIACVVGFHEGTKSTIDKVAEAQRAVNLGATELDVVLNRQVLKDGDYAAVYAELIALRAATPLNIHLKLILETSMLETRQIIDSCALAGWAGWDYVKTSTGFCGHGATVPHVRLLKYMTKVMSAMTEKNGKTGEAKPQMKVKASGGIRSYADSVNMIASGADRIGASAGVAIMVEAAKRESSTSA